MYSRLIAALTLSFSSLTFVSAEAQTMADKPVSNPDNAPVVAEYFEEETTLLPDSLQALPDSILYAPDGRLWSEIPDYEAVGFALDTLVEFPPLPLQLFLPAVYDHFEFADTVKVGDPMFSGKPELRFLEERNINQRNMAMMRRHLFFQNPQNVKYNMAMLLKAPKHYETTINPLDHKIAIHESVTGPDDRATLIAEEVKKRHWIRAFNASIQFSQAYVSPNWYQGGNNNLNMLGQLYYNVKLNQEYHPNLLFDFTAQYKLGINSAPDDSIRNYSISDDLLQLNTNFGIKAANRWYYSFIGQFKTQLFNSYKSNTRILRSAFLSPAEFTGGIGMTYDYTNPKKTFSFKASLAPISYTLNICTNDQLDETAYGIKPGGTTVSKYGSTAELNLFWKMAPNISLRSRLFTHTDYSRVQADWENTLLFEINRFLTTQIYAHMRYDSRGVRAEGTNWKKLQVKEILSIGFSYKFSSL